MAAISINDNIMMLICFHDYLVSAVQIHKYYYIECKFTAFVTLFVLQNGTFQVLAMTLDKYVAIKWPHRAATYSTPRRAKLIVVGLSIFASIIGNQCFNYGNNSVMARVYTWCSFVLNAIIPFTLLIHMNFVIAKTVRNSGKLFGTNDTTLEWRQDKKL